MGKVIMSGIVPKLEKPVALPAVGTALNDCSWEEIKLISDAGEAVNYFAVGDTKTIIINGKVGYTTFSSLSIDAFIIGIDHNSGIEGANRIHFQIGKINGTMVGFVDSSYNAANSSSILYFNMNGDNSNSGGWGSCRMRTSVLGSDSNPASPAENTLLAALPAELRAVMKPVTKYTDNKGGSGNTASAITTTTDYLWLLAEYELFGARTNANPYEYQNSKQAQYAYYSAGNSKVAYRHTATSSTAISWLRSPVYNGSYSFVTNNGAGASGGKTAQYSQGISPAFCV